MRSFTNRAEPEPFEIGEHVYRVNPRVAAEDIVEAMGAVGQVGKDAGASITAEDVRAQRELVGALFAVVLLPEDGKAFKQRLLDKEIDLFTEAVPAMKWLVEELGKRLGALLSGSPDGGATSADGSTDTARPEV